MAQPLNSALHALPDPVARAIESATVPSLPQAILRLLALTDDDTATMSELAVIVEQDPGLCARILHAANSPGLRRGTELHSVAHCLTSLGTRLIRSMATCLSLQTLFDLQHDALRPNLADYWRHSIRVAETARDIAALTGYPRPDEAYLAGLLHDVGELLLLSAHGGPYSQILAGTTDEAELARQETARLGVHHGEIGAWLVDQWQFDLAIGDSILFHHASADEIGTADPLPQILWLSHALATAPANDGPAANEALARTLFGAPLSSQLATLNQRAIERTEQIAQAIGVAAATSGEDETPATLPTLAVNAHRQPEDTAEAEIAGLIRDMALMQPLQRDLFGITSDTELLLSLRESARILFELGHVAFFLRGPDDDRLSAARFGEQPALFRRASIRPDAPHCLVARAAASGRALATFDPDYPAPAALIDTQFARVFGTEGLLCVPMNGRREAVGVMVFGLSAAQHARLKRRLPWVHNFARIAALSLEAWHEAISYRKRADEDASARFEQQARRIVHEAGNPLGIIRSYLKVLDGKLPDDASIREEIGILREEIDRVSAIVKRMSELPRLPENSTGVAVPPLIRDLLAFYDAALFRTRGIAATLNTSEPVETVACDRDSLKQILVNLWKNAAEAMPQGGSITLGVSDGVVQNGRRHVEIRIADNGPGIPAEALARLSEAQVATTASGRGMGLSIVGALVRQAGGTISCRSKPGSGTEFVLLLPSAG